VVFIDLMRGQIFTKAEETFCEYMCLVLRSSDPFMRTISIMCYKQCYKCMCFSQNGKYQ
jgi:hypothetical protein